MFDCGIFTLAMHALGHSCWQVVAAVFASDTLQVLSNAPAVKACSMLNTCGLL